MTRPEACCRDKTYDQCEELVFIIGVHHDQDPNPGSHCSTLSYPTIPGRSRGSLMMHLALTNCTISSAAVPLISRTMRFHRKRTIKVSGSMYSSKFHTATRNAWKRWSRVNIRAEKKPISVNLHSMSVSHDQGLNSDSFYLKLSALASGLFCYSIV